MVWYVRAGALYTILIWYFNTASLYLQYWRTQDEYTRTNQPTSHPPRPPICSVSYCSSSVSTLHHYILTYGSPISTHCTLYTNQINYFIHSPFTLIYFTYITYKYIFTTLYIQIYDDVHHMDNVIHCYTPYHTILLNIFFLTLSSYYLHRFVNTVVLFIHRPSIIISNSL